MASKASKKGKKKKFKGVLGDNFHNKKKSKVMAKFGKIKWVFSTKKLMPIEDDLSGSHGLNDKGKKDKATYSFSYKVAMAAGVNPRKELSKAKKHLGKVHPLYIGKKRFGPAKLKLTAVNPSNIMVYAGGDILSMEIGLEFEEYRKKAKKSSKKKTNSKLSKSKKTTKKKAASK